MMTKKKELSPPRGKKPIPPCKPHRSEKDYDRKREKLVKEIFAPRYSFHVMEG